jgi:uncharacterized protein YggU (UPF0235/DUF167 family)
MNFLKATAAGINLSLRVQPKSSPSGPKKPYGENGNQLVWAVAAAPVNNAANEELERSVAKFFGLPRSAVAVVIGQTARSKIVQCRGITAEAVAVALKEYCE